MQKKKSLDAEFYSSMGAEEVSRKLWIMIEFTILCRVFKGFLRYHRVTPHSRASRVGP